MQIAKPGRARVQERCGGIHISTYSNGKISSVLFIVIYVAIDSTIMPLGHGYSYTYLPNSFLMKGERVQEWMVQQFWWKKKQRSADEWFDYFCMKSRECNNTPSQQNVCCSLSIPSFVFIYYYLFMYEGNPSERNEKTSYVCIYICMWCVCVSVYVCIIYMSMCVTGSVWHCGRFISCCCILGL